MAKAKTDQDMQVPAQDGAGNDQIHPLARPFLWLAKPEVKKGFIWLPVIGLIVTIVLGLVYPFDPHHKAPWDFFASWALIGFIAYTFVVLSAGPLFRLLARPENYYGEEIEPEHIVPSIYGEGEHHD